MRLALITEMIVQCVFAYIANTLFGVKVRGGGELEVISDCVSGAVADFKLLPEHILPDLNHTILCYLAFVVVLGFLLLSYGKLKIAVARLKVFFHSVLAIPSDVWIFLRAPFVQPPFTLWLHYYPEWIRRFFVSDKFFNLDRAYHYGGTTDYLPCSFSLYSKRYVWIASVALIWFVGLSLCALRFGYINDIYITPLRVLIAFGIVASLSAFKLGWPWFKKYGVVLCLLLGVGVGLDWFWDDLNQYKDSLGWGSVEWKNVYFVLFCAAITWCQRERTIRVLLWVFLSFVVFAYSSSIADLLNKSLVSFGGFDEVSAWLLSLFGPAFLTSVILPAIPATKFHVCRKADDFEKRACSGKVLGLGKSNKHVKTEFFLILIFLVVFICSITLKVLYIEGVFLLDNLILYLFILFFTIFFLVFRTLYKSTTLQVLFGVCLLLIVASYVVSAINLGHNDYSYVALANFLFQISLISYLLYGYKFREEMRSEKRGVLFGFLLLISFVCCFIFNTQNIFIELFVLSVLISAAAFVMPMSFHASRRERCVHRKEYAFYLWPLGIRAWSVVFGVCLAVPLFFLESSYYWIGMVAFVVFWAPWCFFSLFRKPVLTNLWMGKEFYQDNIEGEICLNPYTKGVTRFWPFRCLPYFPWYTSYQGASGEKASVYTRVAIIETVLRGVGRDIDLKKLPQCKYALSIAAFRWFLVFCQPVWSGFLALVVLTWFHSAPSEVSVLAVDTNSTGQAVFTNSSAIEWSPHVVTMFGHNVLGRYVFLACGIIWFLLSMLMVSRELKRVKAVIRYDESADCIIPLPIGLKQDLLYGQELFKAIVNAHAQSILNAVLIVFTTLYCIILTMG